MYNFINMNPTDNLLRQLKKVATLTLRQFKKIDTDKQKTNLSGISDILKELETC